MLNPDIFSNCVSEFLQLIGNMVFFLAIFL